jgi:hypothetical protein
MIPMMEKYVVKDMDESLNNLKTILENLIELKQYKQPKK